MAKKEYSFLCYVESIESTTYLILQRSKLEIRLLIRLRQVRQEPGAICEAIQSSQHGAWPDMISPKVFNKTKHLIRSIYPLTTGMK